MKGRRLPGWLFWLVLFGVTLGLSQYSWDLYKAFDARWIIRVPAGLELPFETTLSAFMNWLLNDASLFGVPIQQITRGIAALIAAPYELLRAIFVDGWTSGYGQTLQQILPPLSWVAVTVTAGIFGKYTRDWGLALLVFACFLYLALFGQWQSAMITLVSVLISVPLSVLGGLVLGILVSRLPWLDRIVRPMLDLMQTVPVFAYLVPILFLFGFGPVAALVATMIYALPPMARITVVALKAVPSELHELSAMVGCTGWQSLWKVEIPSARPMLMVGINQVIMLTLNMVIIASMIGAGGLGYDVLTALRRLDIGGGIEAGIAIVVLAIAMDRVSQAFARRTEAQRAAQSRGGLLRRHRWSLGALAVIVATGLAGVVLPALQSYPEGATLSTGSFWSGLLGYVNVHYYDDFEVAKTFLLTWFLLPVKKFFTGIPWAWGIFAMTLIGARMGGWRLALGTGIMTALVALSGLWDKAMITVYLCGVSVVLASLIGIPLGVLSARSTWSDRVVGAFIDTLQTLPSFVYLIPVVMLFRVGDFSAVIAIVAYALAPAVRYAAHGIRSIDPQLIEAGLISGCTPWQIMWRIRLPMILPELILGLNQTIMLALSMVVITALVGTRDLGQEVYIALTRANAGQGIVAGLAVAFIAMIADRLLEASARRMRARLGMKA